jgi:hypothetical protein
MKDVPSHVRLFWWLTMAAVLYWVGSQIWSFLFPTAHYLAAMAKLPIQFREDTRRTEIEFRVLGFLIVFAPMMLFAQLATFRHQNWARWAFAFWYLFHKLLPFALYTVYKFPIKWSAEFPHRSWLDARFYVVDALVILAIVSVFTGNARDWFKAPVVT